MAEAKKSDANVKETPTVTADKPVSTENVAKTETPVLEKLEKIIFYWKRIKGAGFTIEKPNSEHMVLRPDGSSITVQKHVRRKAKNGLLILDPSDEDDLVVINFLETANGNEKNGGKDFARLESKPDSDTDTTDVGASIDSLYDVDFATLLAMRGGGLVNARKSRGTLIAEILELQAGKTA